MTTFGDQVREFGGAPVGSGRFSSPWATHWFVDYDNGSDTGGGKRPDDAFKTIQVAVTAASGGDVIYIRPRAYQLGIGFRRYEEDVVLTQGGTTGSGQVATNANISLIGVSQRLAGEMLGPRWKVATATNFTVQAPATHMENIGFFNEVASGDPGGMCVYLQGGYTARTYGGGDGSSMYNCDFKGGAPIYINGGSAPQIINCTFGMKHDGTGLSLWLEGTGDNDGAAIARPRIQGCNFQGGNANNCATSPVNLQGSIYDLFMRDCYFANIPDAGDYIAISGTVDGVIANCYFGAASAVADLAALKDGTYGIFAAGLFDENGAIDINA